jgi:hypothetical protein
LLKELILLFVLLLSACTQNNTDTTTSHTLTRQKSVQIIKEKNLSLTQNNALQYFFYVEGIDKETDEPNAEVESDYFYEMKNSQKKFIVLNNLKKSNILEITQNYILTLLNADDGKTVAATFKLNGTPINFLLLENSFGTNEFSIQRVFKQLTKNSFQLTGERYDTEWIVLPTKGVDKLTWKIENTISVNKEGVFTLLVTLKK